MVVLFGSPPAQAAGEDPNFEQRLDVIAPVPKLDDLYADTEASTPKRVQNKRARSKNKWRARKRR
jgi:hypothetical protein